MNYETMKKNKKYLLINGTNCYLFYDFYSIHEWFRRSYYVS